MQNKIKIERSKLTMVLAMVFIVVAGAVWFFNKDKKSDLATVVPTANASEIPGWWFAEYFKASVCEKPECAPDADPDRDKLTNAQEYYFHSNPLDADTNNNGLTDGEDVANNYDPSRPGKVSFDAVLTDENILGESLVFNEDIKKEFAESFNVDNVMLPKIDDAELNLINDNSQNSLKTYFTDLDSTVTRYLPKGKIEAYQSAISSGDETKLAELKSKSKQLSVELKKIKTPTHVLEYHKYQIMFYQLLPNITTIPSSGIGSNTLENNKWYDDTKAFFVVMQKMDFEYQKLTKLVNAKS